MEQLLEKLKQYRADLSRNKAKAISDDILEKIYNIYPFNKFEYLISHLIAGKALTISEYLEIRADYIERNKYLYLFELAPRTFGQEWGERHLMELIPEFKIPRKSIDPNFSGEYDLWLDGIRVEIKASRLVSKVGGGSLAEKALTFGTDANFDMNFQQLKPDCCDVFVWIAVWRNKIEYWILTANEVRNHPLFSNQHRGSTTSPDGTVIEGQIHINKSNYESFKIYSVQPSAIHTEILKRGKSKTLV